MIIPLETMGLSKIIRLRRYFFALIRHSSLKKILNFLLIEFQILIKRERISGMPYILKVENTNLCNLQCPVCYENRKKHDFEGARGYGRMKIKDFKKIVDELGPWVFRINLYGFGEPFLYDEIFEMIRYATDHDISVAITSNFNTINQDRINKIIDSGLEHLIISIDGIDQESYTKYKVGGNYEKVINNIKQLFQTKKDKKAKYPFMDWQFLIMKHNVSFMDPATRIARDLGIGIRFSRIGVDLNNEIERKAWLPEEKIRKSLRFEDQVIKKQKKIPLCSWLYRTVFINWDLGISPCCNYYTGDKTYDFGNMKDSTFNEIWNNANYLDARRMFKKGGLRDINISNICFKCIKKKGIKTFGETNTGTTSTQIS